MGEGEPLLGERESLEERGLGEGESLERGLLLELGPGSEAKPIRFGEGDPLDANHIWCCEGDPLDANRIWCCEGDSLENSSRLGEGDPRERGLLPWLDAALETNCSR